MALKLIIVVVYVTIASAVDHPNYCENKYNCQGEKHVGCDNPLWDGGFGSQCKDAQISNITCKLQDVIIDVFNKYRNQIALGKTQNYDTANRMATMTWDWDMADIAELTARTCIFEHDKCRNTENHPNSGQGLAIVYEGGDFKSDEHYAAAAIDAWFAEAADNGARYGWMKIVKSFYPTDPNYELTHFLQMVMEAAYAVGCAQSKYKSKLNGEERNTVLTVCNYASIPVLDSPIYNSTGEPASGCKTGKNSKYPGLCSESEKYEEIA